jgi:hypothetical protein
VSEKEILDFKPAPRLEKVGDEKQMEDRKHRIGRCADSAMLIVGIIISGNRAPHESL